MNVLHTRKCKVKCEEYFKENIFFASWYIGPELWIFLKAMSLCVFIFFYNSLLFLESISCYALGY